MSGIGGVRMWIEDFIINSHTYSEDYRKFFRKINSLWSRCNEAFKKCKSIKDCNNTYTEYEDKVDELREEIDNFYGRNKMPCGLSDTLDYFEEAVGDLEDKHLDRLINSGKDFSIIIPCAPGYTQIVLKNYVKQYPEVKFSIANNTGIKATGQYYDVRSVLEDDYSWEEVQELIDEGEFND